MSKITQKIVDDYRQKRPERITNWLVKEKFISHEILDRYKVGFNGKAITIPVKTKEGDYFFKFRADPFNKGQKLRYWCSEGAQHDLYPREILESNPHCLYLVEGELKALTLISLGYPAICGTGGAGTVKESWVEEILLITKKFIIVPDMDAAGKEGANQWILKLKQKYL